MLKKNKFLGPLIKELNWDQLYFLIVLLILLPSVADSSLFRIVGYSHLDFLFPDPVPFIKILYNLSILLLPVGIFIVFKKRKLWMLLGLLPAMINLATFIISRQGIINIELNSIISFIAYKIAFVVFLVKGHIRSIAYTIATVLIFIFFPFLLFILFFFFTLILKIAYLIITQNLFLLSALKPNRLIRLILRTFISWSPILLFAVPGYLLAKFIVKQATEEVYEETFIDHHNLKTDKDFEDLLKYPVATSLLAVNLDTMGSQLTEINLDYALRVVRFRSDSLQYTDYIEGVHDFQNVFMLFQDDNPESSYASNYFIAADMSQELSKVLVERFLPGRTEFELDIIVSASDQYKLGDKKVKAESDSFHRSIQNKIDEEIRKSIELEKDLKLKANAMHSKIELSINNSEYSFINSLEEFCNNSKNNINNSLDNSCTSIQNDFNKIPDAEAALYERVVPSTLVGVSGAFANSDPEFYEVDEHATNMVKGLLRDVYSEQRAKAKITTYNYSVELKDNLNQRLWKMNSAAKNEVDEQFNAINAQLSAYAQSIANGSRDANDKTYESILTSVIATQNMVEARLHEFNTAVGKSNQGINSATDYVFYQTNKITEFTLLKIYDLIAFINLISNILLIGLIIKSYFYVFSRIAFSDKTKLYVELSVTHKQFENGIIKSSGKEYTIPVENKEIMYVARKYLPTGRAPKIAIPNWTEGIVSRIRNKVYLMNEIVVRESETVDFRSTGGTEFVEWNLSDGEEVVFNYRDLVAFSDSIIFSQHISYRITSMFLGRAIFPIAKGPGKIILLAAGKPIINEESHLIKSVAVERLLAWQTTARFSIDSELGMADMYLSGVYLKRTNDDLIIIDADSGDAKRKSGLARFIKSFLSPI